MEKVNKYCSFVTTGNSNSERTFARLMKNYLYFDLSHNFMEKKRV